jgi:hypothetical protein
VTNQPDRRRTRLVDRKFQFGLAWRLLLVMAVFFVAGIVLVFAPSVIILATGSDLKALEAAAEEFLVLHGRIWPAALLSFAGVFAYCLLFSHRIAGPVHRINAALRQMLQGKPPAQVRFRKGDYFHPTADLLTELCRKLNSHGSGAPPGSGGAPGGNPSP